MYLGIETSSLVSSVALMHEDKLIGELTIQAGLTHSEQLVPHIQLLMEQARVEKSTIEGVVISLGPGSFTGLRIGLGTAKALAYGWEKSLIGVMTMDGLAHNAMYSDRLLSIMIDGQKKNVYEGRYRFDGQRMVCLQPPVVKNRLDALAELAALKEKVLFLGDGAIMAKTMIEETCEQFEVAPMTMCIPRASSLLMGAKSIIETGGFEDPMNILPYYIRRSEAEVLWEKKHNQKGENDK